MKTPTRTSLIIGLACALQILSPAEAKKKKKGLGFPTPSEVTKQVENTLGGLKNLPGDIGKKLTEAVNRIADDARQAGERLKTEAMKKVEELRRHAEAAMAKAQEIKDRIQREFEKALESLPFNKALEFLRKCGVTLSLPSFQGFSPRDLLEAFLKSPDDGLKILRCAYNALVPKLPGLPTFATVEALVRKAITEGTKLVTQDPKKVLKDFTDQATAGLTEFLPKAISHVMSVRDQFREILTLEYKNPAAFKGPFERTEHDGKINNFVTLAIDPLAEPMKRLLSKFVPKDVAAFIQTATEAPIRAATLSSVRMFVFGRSILMQLARFIVPALMEGASAAFEKIPKPPEVIKEMVLAAFDGFQNLFGGVGGALLETLGLKEPIETILGSILSAYDQVKGVMGSIAKMSAGSSAKEIFATFEGATRESDNQQAAAYQSAQAALAAAAAAAQKAASAAVAAEKELALAQGRKLGDAALKALEKALEEKNKAAIRAREQARSKAIEVERLNPKRIAERVIGTVWDTLSEAIMKATWDVSSKVTEFVGTTFVKLYVEIYDIVFAVYTAVVGWFGYTTDWAPMLTTLMGMVTDIAGGVVLALSQVFFSLVVPEFRVFVKDQLVSMKVIFTEMWSGEGKTGSKGKQTMQAFGKVMNEVMQRIGPFAERLRKVYESVKAGASGLLVGPLGEAFKQLPPELWAAISKAITGGIHLVKKLIIGAAVGAAKAVLGAGSDKKVKPELIARGIIYSVKDPLIDYLVSLVPEKPEWEALAQGLRGSLQAAADSLAKNAQDPVQVLTPQEILKIVASGLRQPKAKKALAQFMTRDWKQVCGLEASAERGIAAAADAMSDLGKLSQLLAGGVMGILRHVLIIMKDTIRCVFLKELPQKPKIQASFGNAFDRAFALVEKPEELNRVIGGGVPAVAVKVIELSHEPVTELVLQDFPEGNVKEAIRRTVQVLGKKASSPGFFSKLAASGIPGILGEILTQPPVARALAELFTADLGDAELTSEIEQGIRGAGADLEKETLKRGLLERGLKSALAHFGRPIATYLIRQLTRSISLPGLKSAVESTLQKALGDLVTARDLPAAVRNVPHTLLGGVRTYLEKVLAKGAAYFKDKHDVLAGSLRQAARALRAGRPAADAVRDAAEALGKLSQAVQAAGLTTFPSAEEVL